MSEIGTVFLIGNPRSGTSWLQDMLGSHPEIATPQELDLFVDYLQPWQEAWRRQLPDAEMWQLHRHKGLPAALTEEEFRDLGTAAVRSVYERVLALKPTAHVMLEKTPHYTDHVDLIRLHFPEARFIHLIRDGRDVVSSVLRANRSFGRTWATNSVDRAAWAWQRNVMRAREAADGGRYVEVRYEALRSEAGPVLLQELFAFCGVAADEAVCAEAYQRFAIEDAATTPSSLVWGGEVRRRLNGEPVEPEGFVGEGRIGGWQEELNPYQRFVVDQVAGETLRALGYADDSSWAELGAGQRALAPLKLHTARTLSRARFTLGAARQTWQERPFGAHRPPTSARTGS